MPQTEHGNSFMLLQLQLLLLFISQQSFAELPLLHFVLYPSHPSRPPPVTSDLRSPIYPSLLTFHCPPSVRCAFFRGAARANGRPLAIVFWLFVCCQVLGTRNYYLPLIMAIMFASYKTEQVQPEQDCNSEPDCTQ